MSKNEVQDDPTSALVERYSLSKHNDRLEQYARLGFSTTGKNLRDDFLTPERSDKPSGGAVASAILTLLNILRSMDQLPSTYTREHRLGRSSDILEWR